MYETRFLPLHSHKRLRNLFFWISLPLLCVMVAGAAVAQQTVTNVWVHDVPGPPRGDFWDSVYASTLGLFMGRAGIYPDVVVCARPFSGGARSCTSVCVDLQGDTTLGGAGKSTACKRSLKVQLAKDDPRMQIELLEMDDVTGQPRVHASIAQLGVTDPAACPDDQPCAFAMTNGSVVLSFATEGPPCARPSPQWKDEDYTPQPHGLHGPYLSVDEAMNHDAAGYIAFQLTGPVVKLWGTGNAEYGFLIVRDRRKASGGYYTTAPIRSSEKPSATSAPHVLWGDFMTSFSKAFEGSCEDIRNFAIAATVHTHPQPIYWGWEPFHVDNFSMDDFNQAIQLKNELPAELKDWVLNFEKIFLINVSDRRVHAFAPAKGDRGFDAEEKSSFGYTVSRNPRWKDYIKRTDDLGTYPKP